MGARPVPRPLSRSLDPIAGESLGGYLLRLSWRLRVSPLHLARLTGCIGDGPAAIRRRLLLDLDVPRFAHAARLSASEAGSLTAASWADRYPPIARSRATQEHRVLHDGWLFSASTRYCPDCLAGDGSPLQQQYGGPWKKAWHLPVVFACLHHQRFLREGCPQGHPGGWPAPWRLIAFPSASTLHPAQCRLPPQAGTGGKAGRHRESCGTRLDQPGDDGLPPPGPGALDTQQHLLALLAPQHPASDAAGTFADLRVISALLCKSWPLSEDLMDTPLAAAVSDHVRRLGTGYHQTLDRQPSGILATAGLLTAAHAVRNSTDLERALARHLHPRRHDTANTTWARILSRHYSTCTPALREAAQSAIASQPAASRRKPKRT